MNVSKGFPKGIINIITDYAHTLFYIEELKDKTKDIFTFTKSYRFYEEYIYNIKFKGISDCYSFIINENGIWKISFDGSYLA